MEWKCQPVSPIQPLSPQKMAQINPLGFAENRDQLHHQSFLHNITPGCPHSAPMDNGQPQLVPKSGHGPFSPFWRQSNRAFLLWEEGWDPVLTQRQGS